MVEFEDTSFVFAKRWTSWVFDLKGLNCKELFSVEFESTRVGSSLTNFTKCKLNLVHSTRTLFFFQGYRDYVRNIWEVVGDKYCWLICAGVVEDMGRSVNPK